MIILHEDPAGGKLCPLRSAGQSDARSHLCTGEACAWYVRTNFGHGQFANACAFVAIGYHLAKSIKTELEENKNCQTQT